MALPNYLEVGAKIQTMSLQLTSFNAQYLTDLVEQNMPFTLRVDGTIWSVGYRGADTAFHGPQVAAMLQPNMTQAQCNSLAQTMLATMAAEFPGTQ